MLASQGENQKYHTNENDIGTSLQSGCLQLVRMSVIETLESVLTKVVQPAQEQAALHRHLHPLDRRHGCPESAR